MTTVAHSAEHVKDIKERRDYMDLVEKIADLAVHQSSVYASAVPDSVAMTRKSRMLLMDVNNRIREKLDVTQRETFAYDPDLIPRTTANRL